MTFLVDGTLGGTFPSWTTATRPASPAVGQMGYNTTTGKFDQYTAAGWTSISTQTTGQVLQVVYGTYSSAASTTGTTPIDSGLTATITPSSSTSKILVTTYQPETGRNSSGYAVTLTLVRNSTTIATINRFALNDTNAPAVFLTNIFNVLDSPATTSALTYKVQVANYNTQGTVYTNVDGNLTTIVLMEIAA